MSTNFPDALDALTNPAGTDSLTGHASQHANANDAIEALQAKVGINGSADASSLDYKATQAVAHAADFGNPHGTTAAQVGAIPTSDKGAVSGVAPLDATGKISAVYLPSYVDDVLEYANFASFPGTGETGKIYIALDTNKTYRWSGSAYVYITSGAVDSVAGKTGVVVLAKADVGLSNVDNTTDLGKPISTAQQTALDLKAPLNSPALTGTASITANTSSPALTITQTGTGNALLVEDSASDSTPFVIDGNGNVGVGTTPSAALDVAGSSFIRNTRFGGVSAHVQRRAGGTPSSPTIIANGDGQIYRFDAYDGVSYIAVAQIAAEVDGTPGLNDMPGRLVFSTTADGASVSTERMRIDASGNVLLKSATGALGYGTGAGGTVTQATSKSTAVTLNKPTGKITMSNAGLAAGASVFFAVNNSLVTTNDLVVVGGANTGVDPLNYRIETAQANGNGTFAIRVTNISAGSLSGALQIQFAVIKGASA